ncbi:hypothetical protein BJV74DRAFT_884971 [Russula compacta]|nr:hypothetical protein BJV74DRAFT_884971 [Russula compacta]
MARPPLEPIVPVGPHDLNIFIPRDSSPTVTPATGGSDIPTSPPTSSLSEPSHYPLQRCASSPSQRRPGTRRQSSISYLPADSPRLWTPRTPHIGFDTLERTASLSGAKMKGGHARKGSILQQAGSEPAVLTIAESHADLLQFIAQKESKCLELRTQLSIHESELHELKRKWERIVRREFGRSVPSTSAPSSPAPSAAVAAAALANVSSTAVLNGLVGGVRALAAATTTTGPLLAPSSSSSSFTPASASSSSMPRTRASSSAFAKRVTRQAASISVSSTTTTTSSSSSAPSAGASPRLSQSSMSSVAEEKGQTDPADKVVGDTVEGGEVVSRDSVAKLSPKPAFGAQKKKKQQDQERSPTSSEQPPLSKVARRRSHDSRAPLADALKSLTGENPRASMSVMSPMSVSIPGLKPISAMGLGRANLGEAAQGWVDSVGSKLVELQRGQTFAKGQKRASVLLSDVSQSIFSALAPASSASTVPVSAPPTASLIDEDDDESGSTALGRAMLPDVVAVSARPEPSTPETKDEDEEDWNW